MAKLGIFAALLTICTALGYATTTSSSVQAAGECKRTTFQTKMVQDACATGGQKAAKDAMKAFLKDAKVKVPAIKGCPTCHSVVGKDYPLTKDALKFFKEAGGELLEATPAKPAPAPTPAPKPAPTPAPAPTPTPTK